MYIYLLIFFYKHTQSFCSATQPEHEAWTSCKQISHVLKALRQASGSTSQRKWYLSYAVILFFSYMFMYSCMYFTHLFGLVFCRDFTITLIWWEHANSLLKKQCIGGNVSGCSCLDFALSMSFRFQDPFKVSSLLEDASRRQSWNENLHGAYLLSYGNLAEVNMTMTIACIRVGLSFQYYGKGKKNISGWLFATGFLTQIQH